MKGEQRRQEILKQIKMSLGPVSGAKLAKQFQVSRQVIVQDIALLRAGEQNIISTNRGYVLPASVLVSRSFYVYHDDSDIQREMNLIVDCGGKVEDVYVCHEVYGRLSAKLSVDSRKKVSEFVAEIRKGNSSPLKNITSGYHYHTVYADSEKTLDMIEEELRVHGFLVS